MRICTYLKTNRVVSIAIKYHHDTVLRYLFEYHIQYCNTFIKSIDYVIADTFSQKYCNTFLLNYLFCIIFLPKLSLDVYDYHLMSFFYFNNSRVAIIC